MGGNQKKNTREKIQRSMSISSLRRARARVNKTKTSVPLRLLLNVEDDLKVVDVPPKGRGIVSERFFEKGDFVVQYKGELIDFKEAKEREKSYDQSVGSYMLFFKHNEKSMCIDATAETTDRGRLVNHDSDPNLAPKVFVLHDKEPVVGLVAIKKILPGDELTYDYGERRLSVIQQFPWLKKKDFSKKKQAKRNQKSSPTKKMKQSHSVVFSKTIDEGLFRTVQFLEEIGKLAKKELKVASLNKKHADEKVASVSSLQEDQRSESPS